MRFGVSVLIGALLGTGAVLVLVQDNSAPVPTPTRAVFSHLAPYKPPPTARSVYNYGSGG